MNIKNNSINAAVTNVNFGANNKIDKANLMQNSINELIEMIERGAVPEYGKYAPISSKFQNENLKLNASDITLSIEPSILLEKKPKEREINIKVYSNTKARSYFVTLFRGEIKEILKYLKNDELPEKIINFIEEASSKFNEYD